VAAKPVKRVTLTVKEVAEGKIKGQRIVRATGRKQKLEFDLVEGLFDIDQGSKIRVEFYDERPSNMEGKYIFCGHGYVASKPGDPFTIFSVWGILFKFEPPIDLEYNKKYYICIAGV